MKNASGDQQQIAATPTTFQNAEAFGLAKVAKSPWQSFMLSIFAGAFIAIAFVFYITVTNGSTMGWGMTRFIGGIAFSLGLILVVVCGTELFTSTVLTSIPWAQKKVKTATQLRCWARVYAGNLVGALLMVFLIMSARMFELNDGQWGLSAMKLAQHKIHHTWSQAFTLGILCNMLVCLAVWMTFATKDLLTKSLLMILPVAMFVSSGFEHSIANMFMVPIGIAIHSFAPDSFYVALNLDPQQFADLTVSNFVFHNLIPVTLGNIVGGGVFVGIGFWLVEQGKLTLGTDGASHGTITSRVEPKND
ncbi:MULTISPECIES: formate transporter FocA [unclassified Shewanella]|uniref:formate transporter FocA n=1 Tax=unclassified Shewanella TaxID=196818 RepID=UPI000C823BC4|nr:MULTISPECIES: formate transporter FocA [unclassified Shewanella]MDO6619493.1 formate transporter FocA [Shewanella sp. 6_MG-2023]MDO6775947.1 formate transporter FocA [Shewanella sp. 3_MG-2023]PMG30272.1 formate transporter FocA [Shewanella sp. 10N.286.52.C2]PMG40028.1 formate transporter FocA [Shewanella sp. 10N.286.52.B9]PMH85443.1 formate transporter FocA [Shewanella sp. 10N.286.48.B5]